MAYCTRFVATLFIGASAAGSAGAQPVPPGKIYAGSVISFRAPQSEGWRLIQNSSAGMTFASKGARSDDSYVAAVNFFPLETSSTPEELIALIKRGIDEDTSKQRFQPLDMKYEYTEQRGYPCVRANTLVNDKNASTGLFSRKELKMETRSLYCRHPKRQESGFAAIFSHRGEALDPELDGKARSFIEGVQVPGHESPNPPLAPTAPGAG